MKGCLLLLLSLALSAYSVTVEDAFPGVTIPLPTDLTHDGVNPSWIYVVSKLGLIYRLDLNNTSAEPLLFLNITDRVFSEPFEAGLLGLAFPPDFETSRTIYLFYSAPGNDISFIFSHLSKMELGPDDLPNPDSEFILLSFAKPFPNHNGGQIHFGRDNMLYISTGDGGYAGDPYDNAQDLGAILGKMLRIDVRNQTVSNSNVTGVLSVEQLESNCVEVACSIQRAGYSIPVDNPFSQGDGALLMPEIWAYGLRNPWRWSFDRSTGLLFLGDAGQDRWEEIDIVPRAGNMGWDFKEGPACFEPPANCTPPGVALIDPIYSYPHNHSIENNEVVIGGYVYRGREVPELIGKYVFGDNGLAFIKSLTFTNPRNFSESDVEVIVASNFSVSAFGEDLRGELYALEYFQGKVFKFVSGGNNTNQTTPPNTTFTIFPVDSSAWNINGELNPTLHLVRGQTYILNVQASPLHPFFIKPIRTPGFASAYRGSGLSANGVTSPTEIIWRVEADAPDRLFYVCAHHPPMSGIIDITS